MEDIRPFSKKKEPKKLDSSDVTWEKFNILFKTFDNNEEVG
jgi:hypothetical protein